MAIGAGALTSYKKIDEAHIDALLKKEMEEKGEKPLYDFYAETLMDAAEYIIREGKHKNE